MGTIGIRVPNSLAQKQGLQIGIKRSEFFPRTAYVGTTYQRFQVKERQYQRHYIPTTDSLSTQSSQNRFLTSRENIFDWIPDNWKIAQSAGDKCNRQNSRTIGPRMFKVITAHDRHLEQKTQLCQQIIGEYSKHRGCARNSYQED